jgi:hypothetical protein
VQSPVSETIAHLRRQGLVTSSSGLAGGHFARLIGMEKIRHIIANFAKLLPALDAESLAQQAGLPWPAPHPEDAPEGNTMFSTGRLAARSALAAGLLIAAATLSGAPALAAPAAPAAPAVRTAPDQAGTFETWPAAQKAAGFLLFAPHHTAGLKRNPVIGVTRCKATAKVRFDVTSEWGAPKTFLLLDQNVTSPACIASVAGIPVLATYKVAGVTYKLSGACGIGPLPSCTSKAAELIMNWKIGPHFYTAFSIGFLRGTLLSFATSLKKI